MTWWMVAPLVLAGLIGFIALFPVGIYGAYRDEEKVLKARLGPWWITVLPLEPKEEPGIVEKFLIKEAQSAGVPVDDVKTLELYLPKGFRSVMIYLQLLGKALNELRMILHIRHLRIHVTFGGDPADAAIRYGRAWAAFGVVIPTLDRLLKIKKRDIQPVLDYNGPEEKLDVLLEATVPLGQVLLLVLRVLYGIVEVMKEGANHDESSSV